MPESFYYTKIVGTQTQVARSLTIVVLIGCEELNAVPASLLSPCPKLLSRDEGIIQNEVGHIISPGVGFCCQEILA